MPLIIPNKFAARTGSIQLAEMDDNFQYIANEFDRYETSIGISGVNVTLKGTTTLNSTLSVAGAATLNGGLSVPGTTTLGTTSLTGTLSVAGATTLSGALSVSGNVGIGTNTPNSKLDVSFEAAFNSITPGFTKYGLHFSGQSTADYATGITFSAGNATASNANAGIYVQGSGAYGSKMYLATTDSYATGAKTRLMIDHVGRVFVPSQPAFAAWNIGGGTALSGNIVLNTILVNTGGHYSSSTGRFTAPVSGRYLFNFTGFIENNATSGDVSININGAQYVRTYSNEATGVYRPFAISCIANLSANDYVQPNAVANLHANANPVFSGYLLG